MDTYYTNLRYQVTFHQGKNGRETIAHLTDSVEEAIIKAHRMADVHGRDYTIYDTESAISIVVSPNQ